MSTVQPEPAPSGGGGRPAPRGGDAVSAAAASSARSARAAGAAGAADGAATPGTPATPGPGAGHRALFDALPDAAVLVDAASGVWREVNAAFCRLLGAPPEALLGLSFDRLVPAANDSPADDSAANDSPADASAASDSAASDGDVVRERAARAVRTLVSTLPSPPPPPPSQPPTAQAQQPTLQPQQPTLQPQQPTVQPQPPTVQAQPPQQHATALPGTAAAGRLWLRAFDGRELDVEWQWVPDALPGLHLCTLRAADASQAAPHGPELDHAFRRALESSLAAGVAAVDPQGRLVHVNAAFCRMVGWSEDELLGLERPFPFWAPEDLPATEAAFARALRGEAPRHGCELRFRRKDGEAFPVQVLVAPLAAASGEVLGWLGCCFDLTEQQSTEQRLRRSQEDLQFTLEAARVGTWRWDMKSGNVDWSPNLPGLHGLQDFGGTFEAFVEDVHPDDRARVVSSIQSAMASGEPYHVEYRLPEREGQEPRWIEAKGRLTYDAEGRPAGMTGICMDVSERKRAEQAAERIGAEYRAIFEYAGSGKAETDLRSGRFLRVNRKLCELTGRTREDLLQCTIDDVTYPDDRGIEGPLWTAMCAGERTEYAVDKRYLLPDGRTRWVRVAAAAIQDTAGRPVTTVRTVQDISSLKAAEEQLRHQARLLERSNADLEDFAYIASHDLQEPLRGIRNYVSFLFEDHGTALSALDADVMRKLRVVDRLATHASTLLAALLEYSRVGRTELAVDAVDLEPIVADVLESLHAQIEDAGVEVVLRRPLPRVRCDRVRTAEVFRNLISNAIKYNDKPRKVIEVGAAPAAGYGAQPVVYVRDNGIGISARHAEMVFKVFKRLHAKDRFGGGAGAGLAIAKKIVERHGGRIWLESAPGEGTTFFFCLGGE